MNIAYYMPFKAMGHSNPSGDLIIGTEIFNHLKAKGNNIAPASTLRCRWIYYQPFKLLQLLLERKRITKEHRQLPTDLWLSYHTYYKAPDLLGPYCAEKLGVPYVIFQGIYSTKRRKKLITLPGFLLNRRSLTKADHIFTNKHRDYTNLLRLIPPEKLTYIAPGIEPDKFIFSSSTREKLRKSWAIKEETVILTAAMMRPGVKTIGISTVIESCKALVERGHNIKLIIVGDGEKKEELLRRASQSLKGRCIFTGQVKRDEMYKFYSSADIFAFPGISESLGMVYLEAQSCRLPAVAYKDWGASEAIVHNDTGLLSPASDQMAFTDNIARLIANKPLRESMGKTAETHIRANHDLRKNYNLLQKKLQEVVDVYDKTDNKLKKSNCE